MEFSKVGAIILVAIYYFGIVHIRAAPRNSVFHSSYADRTEANQKNNGNYLGDVVDWKDYLYRDSKIGSRTIPGAPSVSYRVPRRNIRDKIITSKSVHKKLKPIKVNSQYFIDPEQPYRIPNFETSKDSRSVIKITPGLSANRVYVEPDVSGHKIFIEPVISGHQIQIMPNQANGILEMNVESDERNFEQEGNPFTTPTEKSFTEFTHAIVDESQINNRDVIERTVETETVTVRQVRSTVAFPDSRDINAKEVTNPNNQDSVTMDDAEPTNDDSDLENEGVFPVDVDFEQLGNHSESFSPSEGSGEFFEDTFFSDSALPFNENEDSGSSASTRSRSGRILDMFSNSTDTSTPCKTPTNKPGHCRRFTHCLLHDILNNFNLFLQYVCLIRGTFVGICCPDNPVIEVPNTDIDNSTEVTPQDIQQPPGGCGVDKKTRIVGGMISQPHEWTWMVALLRRNRFYCGGVIINNWYVLTAAHCVLGIRIKDLKVRLGEYNFNTKNEHQKDIEVAEIKRHAQFVTLTFQNDIALLKLKEKIMFTKFVGSICMPDGTDSDYAGSNATVVGWGTLSFGGAASPILRQVTIPVWENSVCDKTYFLEDINESFLCAGSPENGEDACQGDSGGPLMVLNGKERWEVIGIVSWGRRCGDPTYPGVYTRITTYLGWIEANVR